MPCVRDLDYFFRARSFAHRASLALRARCARASGVIVSRLRLPPAFPPRRPSATAAGFFAFGMTHSCFTPSSGHLEHIAFGLDR